MYRHRKLRDNYRKCAKKCGMLCLTVIMLGMVVLTPGVSGCLKSSVVYIDDSDRIALLDVNEPAPFRGVLITEGRHERLLDYEDEILSR